MMNINDELTKLKPSVEAEGSESFEWMLFMQVLQDLPILSDAGRAGCVCKES
jgi:hypothetical protein